MEFEEALPEINRVIALYRGRWTLAYYSWEDLAQDIRIHAFKKWKLYDQNKPLANWVATVTQNYMKNELRNRYYIFQPPCLKCAMHLGEGQCKLYGEVSVKCELFKKFMDQKGNAANVNFPVSYEQSNYDAKQDFTCTPKEFVTTLYDLISGLDKQIFHLSYASGFSSTKIARSIQASGDFQQKFDYVEESLLKTKELARDIIEDKKICMGLDFYE